MSQRAASWLLATAITATAATSHAHLRVTSPPNRYGDEQKAGPCGRAGGGRSSNVTTFAPGQTITVSWQETIDHPGHFRISFDPDGDDDFVDPAALDDVFTNSAVLVDNIPDEADRDYSVAVTLPDLECDTCTIQVIQVMYDKAPPLGPPNSIYGDNDIYYNCADVVLRVGGGGEPDDPGGCRAGSSDAGALPALLALLGVCWNKSRRRRGRAGRYRAGPR
jgi:hypothetical protein